MAFCQIKGYQLQKLADLLVSVMQSGSALEFETQVLDLVDTAKADSHIDSESVLNILKDLLKESKVFTGRLLYRNDKILYLTYVITHFNELNSKTQQQVLPKAVVNIDQNSFISLLSLDLNRRVFANIKKKLYTVYYDPDANDGAGKINFTASDSSQSIQNLREEYWRIILNTVGMEDTDGVFFDMWSETYISKPRYEYWMQKALNIVQERMHNYNMTNGILTSAWTRLLEEDVIKPLVAIYVLNNFDTILTLLSDGLIQINYNKGFILDNNKTAEGDIIPKYSLLEQTQGERRYNDENYNTDPEKVFGKHVFAFLQLCPNGKGEFITKEDIIQLITNIKTAVSRLVYADNPILAINLGGLEGIQALLYLAQGTTSQSLLDSLYSYLKKYNETFLDTLQYLPDEDLSEYKRKYDFVNSIINEIINSEPVNYISFTAEDETRLDSSQHTGAPKSKYRNALKERLKYNIIDNPNNTSLYFANIVTMSDPSSATLVYSFTYLNWVTDITGIDIDPETYETLFADPINAAILQKFVSVFVDAVKQNLIYKICTEDDIADFVTEFAKTKEFVRLTDLLVQDKGASRIRFYNQNLDPIPSATIPNEVSRFSENAVQLKQQIINIFGEGDERPKNANILLSKKGNTITSLGGNFAVTYPGRYVYRSDVSLPNGQIKRARALSAEEGLAVAFNSDFLDNYLTNGVFANLLACFSDKVRHALGIFNAHGKVLVPTTIGNTQGFEEKFLDELSILEINDVAFNLFSWYYKGIEKLLCKDLSILLGKQITNIDQYAEELEKRTIQELRELRYLHPELQIYDLIHWDALDEIRPVINNSLYYNIKMAYNKDLYIADLKLSFNNFKATPIPVSAKFFDSKFIYDNIEDIKKLLSDGENVPTDEDIKLLFNQALWGTELTATWNTGITSGESDTITRLNGLLDIMMQKYFYLTNLMTDADLQIVGKFSFIHPNKDFKNNRHTYSELSPLRKSILNGFVNSELWKDLKKDASARYQASTKRNSSMVAATLPMVHTNRYGVAETMRICHILNLLADVYNLIGEIKEIAERNGLDVHDGMVLSTGVQDFLENNSFLGKNYRGTKKVLGVIPYFMGFTQIKCADFVITNAMVRDSFKETEKGTKSDGKPLYKYDMRILLQKALINLFSDVFFTAFDDAITFGDLYSTYKTKIFRNFEGEYKLLRSITLTGDRGGHEFIFDWDGRLERVNINSAWDLYCAFGREYCYEQDSNGDFIFSELSLELVARFICNYDSDYKTKMIAKYADISAIKPGICNDNPTKKLIDPNAEDLLTLVVDTSRWGVQQDASHESDDATVPNPTLVLTAVLFNGQSQEEAEELNKTLAKVVEKKLSKLKLVWGKENGDHFEYYTYLANMLSKSLAKQNYSISDAPEIVADVLRKVMLYRQAGYTGEMPIVPFSDSHIFYKLASDILSEVNHEMIRQKMAGIPIIQNPSHGIIGIYEDKYGNTYMRSDLLLFAKEQDFHLDEQDLEEYFYTSTDVDTIEDFTIEKFLERSNYFGRELVDIKSLQIGDNVILVDKNGKEERVYIAAPMDLWALEAETRAVFKDFTKLRDLRPTSITFKIKDSGKLENLWFLNSTKALIRAGENKSLILKQWHKANLAGLGNEENPHFFDTLEDFLEYKRGGENRAKEVYAVNVAAGEQVISKLNRTAHDLGHKSLSWINRHSDEHFSNVARARYIRLNKNNTIFDEELTAVYTDKEISIVVDEDKELYPSTNIVHEPTDETNNRYGVYLSNGELLVYSNTAEIGVNEADLNGKAIITIHVLSVDKALDIANSLEETPNTWNTTSNLRNIKGFVYNNSNPAYPNGSETDEELELKIQDIANNLFSSFTLSNRTISLRIPSLSFQSFMYNKTVGFLDGEKNDGYVNVWEIWFLGSDYDIDKAYTLMYEVDGSGLIAKVSPLIDYSTELGIIDNFKLPLPETSKIISVSDQFTITQERISKITGTQYLSLEAFDREYTLWSKGQQQKFQIKFQKELGEHESCHLKYTLNDDGQYVKSLEEFNFVKDSNKHNNYTPSVAGLKNRMTYNIMAAASSLKNLWASQQPMSADPVNVVIEELEGNSEKPVYDPTNPFTKFLFLEFNSVGKDCVGIAANGVKVDGSLLQYFNNLYSGRLQTEYGDVKIDLNFLLPDGTRYKKTFTRFANTKIDSYDTFNSLFEGFTSEELREFTEYKKLTASLPAIDLAGLYTSEALNDEAYLRQINTINNVIGDRKLAEEIILWAIESPSDFNSFKTALAVGSDNDSEYFKKFLYFRTQFEDNAADTLSIFISLATDNAKELKLYKINGTRELLSMGLAMVALGVDLKTTLSVTKFLLDPVAKYLNRSAFMDVTKKPFANVRDAITIVYQDEELDEATKNSLLKINMLAAEMNSLSSFYKLNLGVTARYEELLDFLQSLSKLKLLAEKTSESAKQSPLYGLTIDIERFVYDSEYQKELCDYMEQFKVGFNVPDVVLKSPSYRAYLEALMWNTTALKKSCFLANVMDSKVIWGYTSKDNIHRSDLIRAARHYIIGKTLDKMNWIQFNIGDIKEAYSTYNPTSNTAGIINLRSNSLINLFVQFIENQVIPDWKNDPVIGQNYFIKELTKSLNRYRNREEYNIPYNVLDGDPETANTVNNIQRSFSLIEQLSSKLKIAGTNRYLTIGEVMYLYNLIVQENSLGTLSKIVNSITSDIPGYYRQTAKELDDRVRAGEDFSALFEYFGKLAYASKNGGQSRDFKVGNYTASIDIRGSYIWTKAGYTLSNIIALDDFVKALETYDEIKFKETPYKFTLEKVTFYLENGNPITIYNMGQFSVNNGILSISGNTIQEIRRLLLENNPSIYQILSLGNKKAIVYEEETLTKNAKHIREFDTILSSKTIKTKVMKKLLTDFNLSLGIAYIADTGEGFEISRMYVAKYPGRNYLVLNSSLLNNIEADNDSFEFLQLLDILLLNTLEDAGLQVSIENKAAKLVELLTNKETAQEYLKNPSKVEADLSTKSKELFEEYVNRYLNDVGNSYIADECRIELNSLALARLLPEIFYKSVKEKYNVKNCVTELIETGSIKVGDVITPKLDSKIQFIYLGEIVGKYYFASSDEARKIFPHWVVSDRIRYSTIYKLATLKRSKNDPIGEFTFTDFKYNDTIEKIKADRIYKGFKLQRNAESLIVLEAILKGDNVYMILKPDNGLPFQEIVPKTTTLTGYGISGDTTYNAVVIGGNNVIINTINTPELLQLFVGSLLRGSAFKANGISYTFALARFENDRVTALVGRNTATGGTVEVPVENILSVTIPSYTYSRNMRANVIPLQFLTPKNIEAPRQLKIKVQQAEILLDSYKAHLLYNKRYKIGWVGERKVSEKGIDITYKHTIILNENNLPVYSFDGMTRVNNPSDLNIGDFLLQRLNGQDVISEILNIDDNGVTVVLHNLPYQIQETGLRGEQGRLVHMEASNTTIKILKLSDLSKTEMYSYRRQFRVSKYTPIQETSPIERSRRFVEYLAAKFNTLVIYDTTASAEDNWTAKLTENGIIINVNKAGDDILRQGVHEFTHLILADLRLRSPEQYFSMIQAVSDMVKFGNQRIAEIAEEVKNSPEYYSGNDIYEEIIVRYLENYTSYIDASTLTPNLTEAEGKLFEALNLGISSLFENVPALAKNDAIKMTVGEIVKSSLFNSDMLTFNILTLAEDAKLRKLYNLIEYKCK